MKPFALLLFCVLFAPLFSVKTAEDYLFERYDAIDQRHEEIQKELSWHLNEIKPSFSEDCEDYFTEKWEREYQAKVEAIGELEKAFYAFTQAFGALFQLQGERIYGYLAEAEAKLDAYHWYASYLEDQLFDSCWKPRYIASCEKDSPLHAVFTNDCNALREKPHDKNLLLFDAVKYNTESQDCIQLLLDEGGDPNITDSDGNTPLHYAAQHGKLSTAQALIAHGANLEAKNQKGQTPLFSACYNSDITLLLLNKGASKDVIDLEGRTALDYAANWGSKETLQLLFGQKVPYDPTQIFLAAAYQGCLSIVEEILRSGFDVNFQNESGSSALLEASRYPYSNSDLIEFLIQKGANPTLVNSWGESALTRVIESQDIELLTLFTTQDIDLNGKDSRKTPLFIAIEHGWKEGILHLLKSGADVNAVNQKDKKSPLHAAAARGCSKLVRALVEKGADVHALDESGKSIFLEAAEGNRLSLLRYLLSVSEDKKNDSFPFFFDKPPYVDPNIVMKLNPFWPSCVENPISEVEVWDSNQPLDTLFNSTYLHLGYEGSFPISFDYDYIGKTNNGTLVIKTAERTGGTGCFIGLVFLNLESKDTKTILKRVGDHCLGDRWVGSLKLEGNSLEVTTHFVGGNQEEVDSVEHIEL